MTGRLDFAMIWLAPLRAASRGIGMRALVVAGILVASLSALSASPASAEERWGLLTPAQTRAYHACLFESWIQDWCHLTSFAYPQCVVANGGGRYPLEGRRFTEDYCWFSAQQVLPSSR